MTFTAQVSTALLTEDEAMAVRSAAGLHRGVTTLAEAADELRAWFPNWFVYEGGHHVAMHLRQGDPVCILQIDGHE